MSSIDYNSIILRFSEFLAAQMGIYFPEERVAELEKKMDPVAKAFGFEDTCKCMEWLMQTPLNQKQTAIIALYLTIGETYFFRNSALYSTLEKEILPPLLNSLRIGKNLRIWCAGCCSGEEPYSIAILLHKLLPNINLWKISLLGTDINEVFLEKAKKGLYKKWSFRNTPEDIKAKYFSQEGAKEYRISPSAQKLVSFKLHNLVENNYGEKLGGKKQHIIFCNNVLIYFSPTTINTIVSRFSNSLEEGGWLCVSAVEVPFINDPTLVAHHFRGIVFFKKTTAEIEPKDQKFQEERPDIRALPKALAPQQKNAYALSKELYAQHQYEKVISLLIPAIESSHLSDVQAAKHLLVRTYANQGNFSEALTWCAKILSENSLDPLAHHLHAIVLEATAHGDEAIKAARRALFLDSSFVMAYYTLGSLLKQNSLENNYKGHFKTALRLLKEYDDNAIIPGTEDLLAGQLKQLLENEV